VRGKSGSFDRTKRGIEYLLRARNGGRTPTVFVNTTISRLNVDVFEKVIPFSEQIGADIVAFEYAGEFPDASIAATKIDGITPEPYYVKQNSSILLNHKQAQLLKSKMKAIREKMDSYKIKVMTKNVDILRMKNMTEGIFDNKRCYVSKYVITVDPFGNCLPCPFFNNYYLGNITQQHLTKIRGNAKHRTFLRERAKLASGLCQHCILNVERNYTFAEGMRRAYFTMTRKGYDK
jgi:MoaA/NifB/PqqE/SkfB family radical SAM enzyme